MVSIRQNIYPDLLPDFRNVGVIARVLVALNLAALGSALASAQTLGQGVERFLQSATLLEPLAIGCLVALFAASPLLSRLPYLGGWAAVMFTVLAVATALHLAAARLMPQPPSELGRTLAISAAAVLLLAGYFRLFAKAYSPALAEARLQALQSRIRPHFLFNSLNAVLSLIRRDPRRAERALEDLADLFRTLMSDPRKFVSLADEIALLERYAALEELRLGERLRIVWELDGAPLDALLPPLVLQPLLENAVYHGVEPATGPAEVLVRIGRHGERVHARIENPHFDAEGPRTGNRMALENIRERLALFFDAEAHIETGSKDGRYSVDIDIPYRTRSP